MSKKAGLRGVGKLTAVLSFDQFAAETVAIEGGVLNQVERVGRETEFVLRDGQGAFGASHKS